LSAELTKTHSFRLFFDTIIEAHIQGNMLVFQMFKLSISKTLNFQ